MNLIKYFSIQCTLFGIILLTNFYIGDYIGKPFTYIDLMAILCEITILILVFSLSDKLKSFIKPPTVLNKILLSVFAFIISFTFIGIIIGEIQFNF